MGGAGPWMMGASMGLQVFGSYMQAKALKAQGKQEREYYYFLAKENESEAEQVLKDAEEQVTLIQDSASRENRALSETVRQVEGAQKADLAASGVGLDSVTAEDIARETNRRRTLDEMTIRFNADVRSYETKRAGADSAHQLRTNAIFNRATGANVYDAARMNATTSLLTSAASVSSNWANWMDTSRGRRTTTPRAPARSNSNYTRNLDIRPEWQRRVY